MSALGAISGAVSTVGRTSVGTSAYRLTLINKVIATTHVYMAHSPVMCEIVISNCQKINLIIAYCYIFVLREEHLENAFA